MVRKKADHLLKTGFARLEITPATSLEMGGYIARKAPAARTHDPLFVKAVSFGEPDAGVVLLSLDLLCVSGEWCDKTRQAIAGKLGVPADHILLAATHTHSGPAVFFPAAMRSDAIAAYEELLIEKCVQAAESAFASGEPSLLKARSTRTNGIVLNRTSLSAPADDLLSVVRIESRTGKIRGHLVSFSCHPTVMPPENLEYSADLFGAAAARVERKYPGSSCIMFNGAAGDLSTRFTRRDQSWEELDRLGRKLAARIVEASKASRPVKSVPIEARMKRLNLPLRPVLPAEQAQKIYDDALRELNELQTRGKDGKKARLAQSRVEGATAQLLLSRFGGWESLFGAGNADVELQAVRIGDLIFCGLPGEFFGRRGWELVSAAKPRRGFVIGCANGYWGYLVPPLKGRSGGYEELMAPLKSGDEGKIIRQIKALVKAAATHSRGKRGKREGEK